jgi:hypothetical protein
MLDDDGGLDECMAVINHRIEPFQFVACGSHWAFSPIATLPLKLSLS